jgi:hypothetical protein
MNLRISLPKHDPAKIRSGVRPGKIETSKKSKAQHQRRYKHQKREWFQNES